MPIIWIIKNSKWYLKVIIVAAIIVIGYLIYNQGFASTKSDTTYQTDIVTKGTLINSISASGSITSGNTVNLSTKASGTVAKVYVQNGDLVKKGDKILDIILDSDGIESKSKAWQTYLQSKEAVVVALKDKQDLSIKIWQQRQAILDAEEFIARSENLEGLSDDERHQKEELVPQAKLAFDITSIEYSHADSAIAAAKIIEQASYLDYLDVSGTIIAPADGIINNLTLTTDSTLVASTNQSTSTGSSYANSQNIGFIRSSNNQYQAKVNLTEVDAIRVQAGQKVTITLDAHGERTFTGSVLAVDVSGTSNSGVSSYPAIIQMDATDLSIYPNMSVAASIITNVETDVLLVPATAITTIKRVSTIQILKNGEPFTVSVQIGDSNDSQVIITDGLSEGETIVTGSSLSKKNNNSTSEFSSNRTGAGTLLRGPGL